jgi:hypothetical protein
MGRLRLPVLVVRAAALDPAGSSASEALEVKVLVGRSTQLAGDGEQKIFKVLEDAWNACSRACLVTATKTLVQSHQHLRRQYHKVPIFNCLDQP